MGFICCFLPWGVTSNPLQVYSLLCKGGGAKHTLSEKYVTDSSVDVLVAWLSAVDHKTIHKLHGLGSLTTELSRHNNLAALGTALHDESENTIASPSDGKTSNELVTQGFSLGDGTETTGGNLLSIKLDSSFGEVETLLHN